jgi:hypothetical protein
MSAERRTRSRALADATAKRARAVRLSAEITRTQWRLMKKPEPARIEVRKILQTLTRKRIPFVLTGAHALGGWTGDPRATHDVDILLKAGRNHARAVKALRELYPHLEVHTFFGVTASFVPGDKRSVINVIYPHRADMEETLVNPMWLEDAGLRYRVPSLEALLANKYGAMLNLSREPRKRLQDAADFTGMVRHAMEFGQQPVDLVQLRELGEMVWAQGGGKEVLSLVSLVVAGDVVNVNQLHKLD